MPEKVRLAQTLLPNVNTCTGQPLTFAESSCTVCLKQYANFLSFFSFICHRPRSSLLLSRSVQIYSLQRMLSCEIVLIRIILFAKICFNHSSDGDGRDCLEAPRLLWFIHDNAFLEAVIELKAWMPVWVTSLPAQQNQSLICLGVQSI